MDTLRYIWAFLIVAPVKNLFGRGRDPRDGFEAYKKRLRVVMEVQQDQARLAVRYGPLGWGALGDCPHRSGDRFYTTASGALVRFSNASWARHAARSSTVLMPDGRVLNAGIAQDDEEKRGVANGDLRRVA